MSCTALTNAIAALIDSTAAQRTSRAPCLVIRPRRIVVSDTGSALFSGPLGEQLDDAKAILIGERCQESNHVARRERELAKGREPNARVQRAARNHVGGRRLPALEGARRNGAHGWISRRL